jgi:hypothetical protein
MTDATPAWLGLSSVSGKARLGVAGRLPERRQHRRAPERIRHGVVEMLRFRLLMIAAAYEDGNDANSLRQDPDTAFKLANGSLPVRCQHLWDQIGVLSYGGVLAHRNPK